HRAIANVSGTSTTCRFVSLNSWRSVIAAPVLALGPIQSPFDFVHGRVRHRLHHLLHCPLDIAEAVRVATGERSLVSALDSRITFNFSIGLRRFACPLNCDLLFPVFFEPEPFLGSPPRERPMHPEDQPLGLGPGHDLDPRREWTVRQLGTMKHPADAKLAV